MATRLDGRQLAATIEQRLQAVVADRLERAGRPPGLAVLRVGDDPASGVYVANKEKACSRIGITNHGAHLPADTPAAEVLNTIQRLNADPAVDGILLQLPLPAGLDEGRCWRPSIRPRMRMDFIPSIWAGCSRANRACAAAHPLV